MDEPLPLLNLCAFRVVEERICLPQYIDNFPTIKESLESANVSLSGANIEICGSLMAPQVVEYMRGKGRQGYVDLTCRFLSCLLSLADGLPKDGPIPFEEKERAIQVITGYAHAEIRLRIHHRIIKDIPEELKERWRCGMLFNRYIMIDEFLWEKSTE